MRLTIIRSSESWSFAQPEGKDVEFCKSKKDAESKFNDWVRDHLRVGADPKAARFVVYKGLIEDATDMYPDFIMKLGPKNGVNWEVA